MPPGVGAMPSSPACPSRMLQLSLACAQIGVGLEEPLFEAVGFCAGERTPPESSLLAASKRETVGQTLLQKAQLGDPKNISAPRQKSPQEPRKAHR